MNHERLLLFSGNANPELAHEIATHVEHELLDYVRFVSKVIVHVDPNTRAGETRHRPDADQVASGNEPRRI